MVVVLSFSIALKAMNVYEIIIYSYCCDSASLSDVCSEPYARSTSGISALAAPTIFPYQLCPIVRLLHETRRLLLLRSEYKGQPFGFIHFECHVFVRFGMGECNFHCPQTQSTKMLDC